MTLEEIFHPIQKSLHRVNEELIKQVEKILSLQGPAGLRTSYGDGMLKHIFKSPGKHLRPALVLLSAGLSFEGQKDRALEAAAVQLAASVELIHTASLIHDDILDEAEYRRNQVSLNHQYGNKAAVLIGDILYAQFFVMIMDMTEVSEAVKRNILMLFNTTTQKMCFGEIYQQRIYKDKQHSKVEEYLRVIESKTAQLMAACCKGGSLIHGMNSTITERLGSFGLNFGLLFQLADDLQDHDHPLSEEGQLVEMAGRYAREAKNALQLFNGNPLAENMVALTDFFVARALRS